MTLTFTGLPASQTMTAEDTINPFAGVTVTDPGDADIYAIISCTDPDTTLAGYIEDDEYGNYHIAGPHHQPMTDTMITQMLRDTTFTPSGLEAGTDTITVSVYGDGQATLTTSVAIKPVPPPPPAAPTFTLYDLTTGQPSTEQGTPPGSSDFARITSDSLIIGSTSPGVFIYAGGAPDNIWLGNNSGNNVMELLNGGMMTGGSGVNTFMIDAINNQSMDWTMLGNFHAGDSLIIWGVRYPDFAVNITATNGLTVEAKGPNGADPYVSIGGYKPVDLIDGRLTEGYGNQAGSMPYLMIHANS